MALSPPAPFPFYPISYLGRLCHAKLQSLRMRSEGWIWRVVLVRPRNPLNIGAAARAMANFGLTDLVLVDPYAPVWEEVRSAVGAEEIIERAQAVQTLIEAVGDAAVVLGTTSGSRRNLDRELISLDEVAKWLRQPRGSGSGVRGWAKLTDPAEARTSKPQPRSLKALGGEDRRSALRAALLFGSEKTGLSNEHMSYCHGLVRIPTASACPSMNLGQAVAVCCYELARAGMVSNAEPAMRLHLSDPANLQSLEHILTRAEWVLEEVGYLTPKSGKATLVKLRRLMMERRLTNSDARILGAVLAQIEWKLNQSEARSQKPEARSRDADG
jgi:tRNA C32,U32 (ribose-2'-O)-methylase TrmJ